MGKTRPLDWRSRLPDGCVQRWDIGCDKPGQLKQARAPKAMQEIMALGARTSFRSGTGGHIGLNGMLVPRGRGTSRFRSQPLRSRMMRRASLR